jgi:hypothetical protein
MPGVEIRSRLEGRAAVIELSGRLTVNDRPGALKDAVAAAVGRGAADVLIDRPACATSTARGSAS